MNAPRFTGPFRVELPGQTRQGRAGRKVIEPLTLGRWINGEAREFTCPPGFHTDGASVPRFFWRLIPPGGLYAGAAAIHDYLYAHRVGEDPLGKKRARYEADLAFREGMDAAGVPAWKRATMFRAVRMFGWRGWGS